MDTLMNDVRLAVRGLASSKLFTAVALLSLALGIGADALRLVLLGIVLGMAGSAELLRVLSSLLFGASPVDVPVYAGVSLLLAIIALVAVWIPASRAARVWIR